MRTCQYHDGEPCINLVEGRTDFCSSHNRLLRKQVEQANKEINARNKAIEKSKERKPRQQIAKQSEKQKERLSEYMKVREVFLLGRWCAYHGHGCIPTDIHHRAGRTGDLLTDTTYFIAVCREAHRMIEERPEWAKENGYSVTRTNK